MPNRQLQPMQLDNVNLPFRFLRLLRHILRDDLYPVGNSLFEFLTLTLRDDFLHEQGACDIKAEYLLLQ